MVEHKKGFSFLKMYLLIGAVAGVFGTLIGYGILIYSWLEYAIISNDEYIAGNRYYEIERCEEPTFEYIDDKRIEEKKTPKEIEECKVKAKERALLQRKVNFKETLIGGAVWGTLFLIVLLIHYPRFMRANKE